MDERVIGRGSKLTTTDDIASMVLRKIRTNMQEKDSSIRVKQPVSDYLTLSREQGCTLVKDQPKLAIKHLLSVVKPAQLKEVCENDLLLDQIELRKLLWLCEASTEDCRRRGSLGSYQPHRKRHQVNRQGVSRRLLQEPFKCVSLRF
jgi:hypothetical protein